MNSNNRVSTHGTSAGKGTTPSSAAYSYPSKTMLQKGLEKTNSIASAKAALKQSFVVQASDKKSIHFNSSLYDKYKYGVGRSKDKPKVSLDLSSAVNDVYTPNGKPDPGRLVHLGKAVTAVRKSNIGRFNLPKDSPPQIAYLHQFSKKKNMVVFVDAKTKVVRGFISTDDIQKWERNLQKRSGKRLPAQ